MWRQEAELILKRVTRRKMPDVMKQSPETDEGALRVGQSAIKAPSAHRVSWVRDLTTGVSLDCINQLLSDMQRSDCVF
jgi:hypothetical protein